MLHQFSLFFTSFIISCLLFHSSCFSLENKRRTYQQHFRKKNKSSISKSKRNNKNESVRVNLKNFSTMIPRHWQIIEDKTQLPEKVDAVFIGNKRGQLTSSINVASEKTSLSQDLYVKEAMQYHFQEEGTLNVVFNNFVSSPPGEFHTIKIEKLTGFGEVTIIQGILVRNKKAFVITLTSPKEEISILSNVFLRFVNSFNLTSN